MSDSTALSHVENSGLFPFDLQNPFAGNQASALTTFSIPTLVKLYWLLKSYSYSSDTITIDSVVNLSGGPAEGGTTTETNATIENFNGVVYIATGFDSSGDPVYIPPCAGRLLHFPSFLAQMPPNPTGATPYFNGQMSGMVTTTPRPSGATDPSTFGPSSTDPIIICALTSAIGWQALYRQGVANQLSQEMSVGVGSLGGILSGPFGSLCVYNPDAQYPKTIPGDGSTTTYPRVGSSNLILQCGSDSAVIPLTLLIIPQPYYAVTSLIGYTGGSTTGVIHSGPIDGSAVGIRVGMTAILGSVDGAAGFSNGGLLTPTATVTSVSGSGAVGDQVTFNLPFSGSAQNVGTTFHNNIPPTTSGDCTGDITVNFDTFWG